MVGRKVKEQPYLFRPIQESWEIWQREESWTLRKTGSLEELAQEGINAYLALPARCVIAAPLWLPKTDPVTARKMAEVELEIHGLIPKEADLVSIQMICITENRILVCAQIFPEPFPSLFDRPLFSHFNASPRFAGLEENALHIWREGSDIVAGFTRGKEPLYWETLPFPASDTELSTWLDCIYLPLREDEFLSAELKFINHLNFKLPTPHFCTPAIHPPLSAPPLCEKLPLCHWKPTSHRAIEKANQKRKAYVLAGLVGCGLYLLFIGIFLTWVGLRHFEVNRMRRKVQTIDPAVHSIMEVQKQWDLLGPTIDPPGFPIEILHLVVKQMPAEGMWLTKFEFVHQNVAISGEAASVSVAAQFFTDISRVLSKIQWDMPPPTLLSNNRAKFVISGKP